MKISAEYEGFTLNIEEYSDKEGGIYWKATCNELNSYTFCFYPRLYRSLDGGISTFKREVVLAKKQLEEQHQILDERFALDAAAFFSNDEDSEMKEEDILQFPIKGTNPRF